MPRSSPAHGWKAALAVAAALNEEARALDELAEAGDWRIGMAGEAEATLADSMPTGPLAIVLGAEGEGMRHNIAGHCDTLARLPISSAIESLNVSNAAAIALYAAATRTQD